MKKLLVVTALLLYVLLIAGLSSCELWSLIGSSDCDKTVTPDKKVSIKATVHVLDEDNQPIADQELKISLYKIPCGRDAQGHVYFEGPTNEQGTRQTTVAYYTLRNSEDEVWVDVHAVNLGNGSADANSEVASYGFDDFIVGSTKEVHLHIYRKY